MDKPNDERVSFIDAMPYGVMLYDLGVFADADEMVCFILELEGAGRP